MGQMRMKILGVLKKAGSFGRLKFACIYGSAAEGKAGRLSDIDVCLYYDIKKEDRLRKLLYTIRGMMPGKYDVQLFQMLPVVVRKEVFRGKFIYCADKGLVYDLAFRTFKEYDDFEPRYKFNVMNTRLKPHRVLL
ncbi:MAG: nucleotidyltransferase domain-containing protein [Candidatus Aenigmarchaeota archaeon]|nr:nucleotidyltransferase domain-containing protein [Candidatus Aenigmarchaeota archaeon]